jgi:hypothetical protein
MNQFVLAFTLVAVGTAVFAVMASVTTSMAIAFSALGVSVSATPLVRLKPGFALRGRGTRRKARARKEFQKLCKYQAATAAYKGDVRAPATIFTTAVTPTPPRTSSRDSIVNLSGL